MPNNTQLPPFNPYRFCFIVEQELGHKTHALNLRSILKQTKDIETRWVLPEKSTVGITTKIPVYRSNWTLQAGTQTRQGLSHLRKDFQFDGLFFHTQVTAVLATDWIRRYPSVISLDATPLQYDSLGDAYDHKQGPDWFEDIKQRLYRSCFTAARHLITWSQWAKDGLVADYGIKPEKITGDSPRGKSRSMEEA